MFELHVFAGLFRYDKVEGQLWIGQVLLGLGGFRRGTRKHKIRQKWFTGGGGGKHVSAFFVQQVCQQRVRSALHE